MQNRPRSLSITGMSFTRIMIATTLLSAVFSAAIPAVAQNSVHKAPRTEAGKPDLNGIWQALSTANWDLQAHAAAAGPVSSLAAEFAIPPGPGVVDGNEIPYLPSMVEKKKQNFGQRFSVDPELKCFLPGVPRATYMPYPFQIVQSQKTWGIRVRPRSIAGWVGRWDTGRVTYW
jgi:hypothetical protein